MAKRGRKQKLDDISRARILEAVADGLSRNRAATMVGIHGSTITRECHRNPEFRNALEKADAECEHHHIKRIKDGARTWQSSAWFLQRKWPKRYGDKPRDDSNATMLSMARALVAASPPPGTTPGVAPPGPVQDDPRRPAIGQDGTVRQAQAGPVAAGPTEEPAPVG